MAGNKIQKDYFIKKKKTSLIDYADVRVLKRFD